MAVTFYILFFSTFCAQIDFFFQLQFSHSHVTFAPNKWGFSKLRVKLGNPFILAGSMSMLRPIFLQDFNDGYRQLQVDNMIHSVL